MRIGLCVKAYNTTSLAERVRADTTLKAEVKTVGGQVVILVTQEFANFSEAARARKTLLERYASGTILNADHEVSVWRNAREGLLSLSEYCVLLEEQGARAPGEALMAHLERVVEQEK